MIVVGNPEPASLLAVELEGANAYPYNCPSINVRAGGCLLVLVDIAAHQCTTIM